MAESIDIIVSFLMELGIKMIIKDLETALYRGVFALILTISYLGITQSSALNLISKGFGGREDVRVYNAPSRFYIQRRISFTMQGNVMSMWFFQYILQCTDKWHRMKLLPEFADGPVCGAGISGYL